MKKPLTVTAIFILDAFVRAQKANSCKLPSTLLDLLRHSGLDVSIEEIYIVLVSLVENGYLRITNNPMYSSSSKAEYAITDTGREEYRAQLHILGVLFKE